MFETELTKLLRRNQSASEGDLLYIAKDNEIAHNVLNEICKTLIDRLNTLEEYTTTQLGKIRYRPEGQEEYLSLKQNFDLIYERLNNLEKK
jgi:hypothetical protein